MQLLLTTPGVLLAQENECFLLKKDDQKKRISPLKVESIVVTHFAQITSQAIVLAMEHKIDLAILDRYGHPVGRFWFAQQGRNSLLRRKQMALSSTISGFSWGVSFLLEKLLEQRRFLRKLADARPKAQEPLLQAMQQCDEASLQIRQLLSSELSPWFGAAPELLEGEEGGTLASESCVSPLPVSQASLSVIQGLREKIMGFEGAAARAYFRCLSDVLPSEYRFSCRSRRPSRDPFNAALNYAYGILYSRVERACLIAGLDTHLGLFHAEDPHRPALVCDLIEVFRGWADQLVVYLFTKNKARSEHFDASDQGVFLNEEGKRLLVPAFNEWLGETIRYRKRTLSRANVPQHEAHRLANTFLQGQLTPEGWSMEITEF